MSEGHPTPAGDPATTAFAPSERALPNEVEASISALVAQPLLKALLDATDVSVVVLNRQRQILVGNSAVVSALEANGVRCLEGLRPGEALGCSQAWAAPGGCGTSRECGACGAVLAILECQRTGATVERECLMTLKRGGEEQSQELRVRASRLTIGDEAFTIVGVRDISAEKRRDALERVFLHDISNTLTPIVNWSYLLSAKADRELSQLAERIGKQARRLQREIDDQRILIQAERGMLPTQHTVVDPVSALEKAAAILVDDPSGRSRSVEIRRPSSGAQIVTDESLLIRVLVNMIKNALEATPENENVRAWLDDSPIACEFRVWNPGEIPEHVALQIFKRSFSTKASSGRGLGTFSMKLFGERYLGGEVGFETSSVAGTTFFLRLPRKKP